MNMHSATSGLTAGATVLAWFIYSSDDERFQRGVHHLNMAGCKRPLPYCWLGNRIAARRGTILARIEEQEGRQ
jgi:hypothetical protein